MVLNNEYEHRKNTSNTRIQNYQDIYEVITIEANNEYMCIHVWLPVQFQNLELVEWHSRQSVPPVLLTHSYN